MGERERRDSEKVLAGKHILDIRSFNLKEFFLSPYIAWRNKRRQEAIRKSIVQTTLGVEPVSADNESSWVYESVKEDDGREIKQDSWVTDLLSEDNTKDKGE